MAGEVEGKGAADGNRKVGVSSKTRDVSFRELKMKSLLKTVQSDSELPGALLIAGGAFFLLLVFKFFAWWLVPVLLIPVGLVAYKNKPLGLIFSGFLAFPGIVYQSPVLGWLYLLILTIMLIEAWTYWYIIAILEILVLAPFAPEPLNFLGGIVIPVISLSALVLGSKRSLFMVIPCVFIILLLSSLWGVQNNAFMPLNLDSYQTEDVKFLFNNFDPPALFDLKDEALKALGSMMSGEHIRNLNVAIGVSFSHMLTLLFGDSGLIQIICWASAVFAIGFIPGVMKHRYEQTIASLSLWILPAGYYLAAIVSNAYFDPLIVAFVLTANSCVAVLEHYKIYIAGESKFKASERAKKFGKFGVQDLSTSAGNESLESIGGYDGVKKELNETIVWPLQQKELAVAYGISPPHGVLLFGPPGTGKTLLMRALSKELGMGFYYVKCSELLSQWYGESERNLTELFQIARRQAPCILFFDEIDSIGKKRESYSSDDVAPRLMSLFLQELDGFKDQKNVIVIGATNIPNKLDHALMRPGRFDKIIYMSLPDKESRNQIFKVHAKKLPLSEDVDFEKLSEISERYSGADLANVCTEAARLAAEEAVAARKVMPVTMAHFRRVLDSIRPSVSLEKLEEYDQFKMDFERRVAEPKKKDDKEDKVTWDDVVGLDDVRKALIEAIELPLLHEDLIKQYKIKPSKGLLLFGPPGCGKTLIVKAAANELKATFLTISGASMLKRGYENAVGIIKETFNRARERAPALIFIDEIESIAPSRDLYSNKVVEDIVTQMLTELDGVKELKNVMLIGATNKPKMIDAALMRPGRLDKIVFIPPPSPESRTAIFKVNLEGIPLEADVNLVELAKNTEGFTGADIASVCQEAKMTLVRRRIHAKEQTEPKLDQKTLVGIASKRRPSITVEHLKEYLAFLKQYGERK